MVFGVVALSVDIRCARCPPYVLLLDSKGWASAHRCVARRPLLLVG